MSRKSAYNHFQSWQNGYYLAFNAFSGAVALMTAENFDTYQQLFGKNDDVDSRTLTDREKEFVEQLRHGSFVCGDDFDEIRSLKFRHNQARFDRTALGLVIAPTLACNMACRYCYEPTSRERMAAAVIEAILAFVEEQAKSLALLDVAWYGGEPLLALDIIEDLTESFLDLGKQYSFDYSGSMITNGYLLDRHNVDRLADLQVKAVQITIDGPARLHDQKRPLKNGQKSFAAIVDNLEYASTRLGVGIRVNIDQTFTQEMVEELLVELEARHLTDRVSIYFGQLEPLTNVCANIAESCYGAVGFAGAESSYFRLLLEHGFRIEKLPTPMAVFCMAQQVNGFVVDPTGYLYKCWNHVGDRSRSVGHISTPVDYDNSSFRRIFDLDVFADPTCRDCTLLPVCMGGCPARRSDRTVADKDFCESWKYNLAPMLEVIAASRQTQKENAPAIGK